MRDFSFHWRVLGLLALLLLARMVSHAQNVGIGATSPTQLPGVNGNVRAAVALNGSSTRLVLADANGNLTSAGLSNLRHPSHGAQPGRQLP